MNTIFSIYLWSVVLQWNFLESNFSLMTWWDTLIPPWHGDHDKRWNRSQLVPIEFKSGPSYVKHTIGHMVVKSIPNVHMYSSTYSRVNVHAHEKYLFCFKNHLKAFVGVETTALTFRTKQYSTSYSSHICYGKRFYNDFFSNHNTIQILSEQFTWTTISSTTSKMCAWKHDFTLYFK